MCQKELYRPLTPREKKSCPTLCCITWLLFPAEEERFSFWNKWRSCSVDSDHVRVPDPPLGAGFARGGGCRFVLDRKVIFGSNRGWQWCHECFLILRARVKFSTRDSPEFSCCSGRGGRGVEPTDVERQVGWRRRRWGLCRIPPFNTIAPLWMTDAA